MIFFSVVCLIEGKKTRHERERETDTCERGMDVITIYLIVSAKKRESLFTSRRRVLLCVCCVCFCASCVEQQQQHDRDYHRRGISLISLSRGPALSSSSSSSSSPPNIMFNRTSLEYLARLRNTSPSRCLSRSLLSISTRPISLSLLSQTSPVVLCCNPQPWLV